MAIATAAKSVFFIEMSPINSNAVLIPVVNGYKTAYRCMRMNASVVEAFIVEFRGSHMPYAPKAGEVCLFESEKAGHERAPDHRGYLVAHRDIKMGERIAIALWKGTPDSARSFRGIASDIAKAGVVEIERDLFGKPLIAPSRSRN